MSLLDYTAQHLDTLVPQTITQVRIVLITMAVSILTGLALGVMAARWERFGEVVLGIASVLLTIPSFALFSLLTLGLLLVTPTEAFGDPPTIIGLVLYAQLPIVRNTRTGIRAVNPAVLEAARGMGMRPAQILLRVELPLALPVILGGIRQATVMVVAIATVGAAIASNNLGQQILQGVASLNRDAILAGVIPVAIIGIAFDTLLALGQRVISRGRITAGAAA
ncbi:MAG: osmoprotectant transport system substrate-binding protein opuBD [Chloroflexota bacterium]|nr:osmoprotectant transport system substrate-binding protein opuBD [Chloroflexota bacterium]